MKPVSYQGEVLIGCYVQQVDPHYFNLADMPESLREEKAWADCKRWTKSVVEEMNSYLDSLVMCAEAFASDVLMATLQTSGDEIAVS